MLRFIVNRLISSVFILLIIAAVAFFIIQLPPGDFADVYKREVVALGGSRKKPPKLRPMKCATATVCAIRYPFNISTGLQA